MYKSKLLFLLLFTRIKIPGIILTGKITKTIREENVTNFVQLAVFFVGFVVAGINAGAV
jgi:hypothetical protein